LGTSSETLPEKLSDQGMEGQTIVPSGTVLVNGIGASIGKVGFSGKPLTFNQQIHGILQRKPLLDDRFLFFVMYTRKGEIISLGNNTTIPIINANRFGRIAVPLPDKDFQKMCVAAIEREVTRIGSVVKKVEASAGRLHEFRSAFITAAVTGQLDVATWGKRGTTDRRLDDIEAEMAGATPPEREKARA
jgi:type I restriction enzyme, S subunit